MKLVFFPLYMFYSFLKSICFAILGRVCYDRFGNSISKYLVFLNFFVMYGSFSQLAICMAFVFSDIRVMFVLIWSSGANI